MTPNEQSTDELVKKLRSQAKALEGSLRLEKAVTPAVERALRDDIALLRAAADRLERLEDCLSLAYTAADEGLPVKNDDELVCMRISWCVEARDLLAATNHAVDHTVGSAEGGTKEGSK